MPAEEVDAVHASISSFVVPLLVMDDAPKPVSNAEAFVTLLDIFDIGYFEALSAGWTTRL